MNAVVYLRVSTLGQLDGFGLDAQEQACLAYAEDNGLRVAATFRDEGVSGTLEATDRDGLMSALARLRDGDADALLVARVDRLARSLTVQEAVLAQVWKHHRAVHSVDVGEVMRDDPDDPMRTAMRQMAGVFAQLDRGMVVKRMRDGLRAKAAHGGRAVGPAPYGYRAQSGMLHPIPAQQEALTFMRDLRAAGQTRAFIAAALSHEGYPTKRGRRWTSSVVSRIAVATARPLRADRPRPRAGRGRLGGLTHGTRRAIPAPIQDPRDRLLPAPRDRRRPGSERARGRCRSRRPRPPRPRD